MVSEAQASGLDVVQGDGLSYLGSLPDGSVGAITAIHVIEHLVFADLVRFLDLAAAKLRPGGVLVCETPNPTALIVLGHSYILDPTHKWPLHPSLITFLCERAGFADVEVRFHSPADFFAVPLLDETKDAPAQVATINEALHRLNSVLFGPRGSAIVATRRDERGESFEQWAHRLPLPVKPSAVRPRRAAHAYDLSQLARRIGPMWPTVLEWWESGCDPPPPNARKRQLLHETLRFHRLQSRSRREPSSATPRRSSRSDATV